MLRFFMIFCIVCSVFHAIAQDGNNTALINNTRTPLNGGMPAIYLGLSAGMNNAPGFVGFDLNIPVSRHVSADAGMGASTWGNKLFFGAKYYLKPHCRGWAFGGGTTFNSGQENRKMKLETVNGRENVTLQLKPQSNAYLAAYHYWTLGRRHNRFYLEAGSSIPLHECHYQVVYGDQLTNRSDDRVKKFCPGGLMAGAGFSFSIRTKQPRTRKV